MPVKLYFDCQCQCFLTDYLPPSAATKKSTEICRRLQMSVAALMHAELDEFKAMLRQTTSSGYSDGLEILISSQQRGVPLKTEKLAQTSKYKIVKVCTS